MHNHFTTARSTDKQFSDEETSSRKSRSRKDEESLSVPAKRNSKEVRFDDRVRRRFVPYVATRDRKYVWYTKEDFEEFLNFDMAMQKCMSSSEHYYRYIREHLIDEGIKTEEEEEKMLENVDASREAVFREQEKQESAFHDADKRGKFSLDWKEISKEYYSHSKNALKEAQARASRHENHLEAIGIKFLGYSSPSSPSTCTKKGILRRHSPKSQKSFSKSSKLEIPGPPLHLVEIWA